MPRIRELFELARLCYAQASDTLNDPKAKNAFQDMGDQYIRKADELSRIELIQAVYLNKKSRIGRLGRRPLALPPLNEVRSGSSRLDRKSVVEGKRGDVGGR